jgi:hypothetical protein
MKPTVLKTRPAGAKAPNDRPMDRLDQSDFFLGKSEKRSQGFARPFELAGQHRLSYHEPRLVGERECGRAPHADSPLKRPTRFSLQSYLFEGEPFRSGDSDPSGRMTHDRHVDERE